MNHQNAKKAPPSSHRTMRTVHDHAGYNQTVYKLDSDMYRTCHEPMLASMGMQKAILYNTCDV